MSNKLIPKMQWAGNIYYNPLVKYTELLGQQAKKELDQYKDTEARLKSLYQDYYKEHMHDAHPLSFEHWVNRETGNSPEATVGPSTSVEPSWWDKVIHAGEYGDSGNGPSISNVVHSPVGTALSFTPLGFAAQAAVNLPSKEGVRKTINDVKNGDYLDAVGSGLMDAIDMTGVGHGVKKAIKASTPLIKNAKNAVTSKILNSPIEKIYDGHFSDVLGYTGEDGFRGLEYSFFWPISKPLRGSKRNGKIN